MNGSNKRGKGRKERMFRDASHSKNVTAVANFARSDRTDSLTQTRSSNSSSIEEASQEDASLEKEPTFTEQEEQRELAELSASDIAVINSDLYGITSDISNLTIGAPSGKPPKQSMVAAALPALDREIAAMPTSQTAAYRRALVECPDEVSNERKIPYLEFEGGDAALAARRLAAYWELRLDVFGPERCFLPMTLSGAMQDEVAPMAKHWVWQLLPTTDASGRQILFGCLRRRDYANYSAEQETRGLLYLLDTLAENADTRERGVVIIINAKGMQRKQHSRRWRKIIRRLHWTFKIQFRAAHVCYPSAVYNYVVLPIMKRITKKEHRVRLKVHCGAVDEVLRQLDEFGLSRDRVPTEIGGGLTLDINEWILHRMRLETSVVGANARMANPDGAAAGPPSKRLRKSEGATKATNVAVASASTSSTKRSRKGGKKPDPRMERAVQARLENPDMALYDALVLGGFVYKKDINVSVDAEGITLKQRKNNLCRRIRKIKSSNSQQESTTPESTGASAAPVPSSVAAPGACIAAPSAGSCSKSAAPDLGGVEGSSEPMVLTRSESMDSFYEEILTLPGLDNLDERMSSGYL